MSASYVALAIEFPDMEEIYPLLESDSQAGRQAAFLSFVSEQFDSQYEEDLYIEDMAFEGGRFIVEFQCSTELCNEVTHTLFECLAENGGEKMLALEYNSRIGVYTCLVPGYDEAEYIDDCFDDFDGTMHELEEFMDRQEQLLRVLEMTETEPVKSMLRELLDEEEEGLEIEVAEVEAEEPEEEDEEDEEPEDVGEEDTEDSNPLMDELKQAMAEQDEERIKALFAQIQIQ